MSITINPTDGIKIEGVPSVVVGEVGDIVDSVIVTLVEAGLASSEPKALKLVLESAKRANLRRLQLKDSNGK